MGQLLSDFPVKISLFNVGFEVFTAVVMKSIIFWDMTPCSPLSCNRRFGGAYRLSRVINQSESRWESRVLILFFDPEDGGDMFLV
jgi:hypothetical protein